MHLILQEPHVTTDDPLAQKIHCTIYHNDGRQEHGLFTPENPDSKYNFSMNEFNRTIEETPFDNWYEELVEEVGEFYE